MPPPLLFRVYNAGLCNQLLGLEAGAGLAALFGRTFVPYGGEAAQNGPTSDPRFRKVGPAPGGGRPLEIPPHHAGKVDPVTRAGLLELFDLPEPFERIEDLLARGPLEGLVDLVPPPPDRARRWLADCIWTDDDPDADPSPELLEFARGHTFRIGRRQRHLDAPILHADVEGLGNSVRIFFLSPARRRELARTLSQIRPKLEYRRFAQSLVRELGPFNAVHLRRTDFKTWLGHAKDVTAEEVIAASGAYLPANERLVLCTDESEESGFFDRLRDHWEDSLFLDRWILDDPFRLARFRELPFHDEHALAVVTLLVAAEAERFAGTMCSTFTGWIHRQRLITGRDTVQRWAYNEFTHVPFADGQLPDQREGAYSWTRAHPDLSPSSISWAREWPEAVELFTP